MDEDITEILNSNGIIGMSLDVRILGFQSEYGISLTSENEYLSTADFHTHFPQITVKNLPLNTMESMISENESWLIPTKEDRHPLSFCFNIIHIIQVGLLKTDIAEPWNQICLGSDFDGLIEPLKISPDISSLEELEANMINFIFLMQRMRELTRMPSFPSQSIVSSASPSLYTPPSFRNHCPCGFLLGMLL